MFDIIDARFNHEVQLYNYCSGSELKRTVEMKTDVILGEKIKVKCERRDARNNQKL